jgi:hypothetical protein
VKKSARTIAARGVREIVFERCARTEGARIKLQDFTLCEDLTLPE